MANQRGIVAGWDTTNNRPKGVTSAADLRASLAGITTDEGIFWQPDFEPARASTSMRLTIPTFTCAIASPLGGYYCPTINQHDITLPVGHTSNGRICVLWVKQWDYQTDADHPDSEVQTGLALGTPSTSPTVPPIPSGAFAAITILVPPGVTNASEIPTANIQPFFTQSAAATATNTLIIDGLAYNKNGTINATIPASAWSKIANQGWLWQASVNTPLPYTPPNGYTFTVTLSYIPSEAFQVTTTIVGSNIRTHAWYYLWSTPTGNRSVTLTWQLTKI